jgi:hypothetical protein
MVRLARTNKTMKMQAASRTCYLRLAGCLLGLLFFPEDGGSMYFLLLNVGEKLPYSTTAHENITHIHRRENLRSNAASNEYLITNYRNNGLNS